MENYLSLTITNVVSQTTYGPIGNISHVSTYEPRNANRIPDKVI